MDLLRVKFTYCPDTDNLTSFVCILHITVYVLTSLESAR
uniref:Uncharacterized protein n=1 Tax=Anguilla anguilla TaxID=7936 RepID=A0A0E9WQ67_ANGAN